MSHSTMDFPTLSTSLSKNKQLFHELLPLDRSFDLITRELAIGDISCYLIALNGMCDLDLVLKIFSEVKPPEPMPPLSGKGEKPSSPKSDEGAGIPAALKRQFLFGQAEFLSDASALADAVLRGSCVILLEGFAQAVLLDTRNYPDRETEEPDTEKVIRGAKDGFVESLITNTSLIRRRFCNPRLVFSVCPVGSLSNTDVALCYLEGLCDSRLLKQVRDRLSSLSTSALTMGCESLKELLVEKSFFHPMPTMFMTSRPDVACSYLAEGYVLLLADNSPFALVLPCNLFQFTQSPEDYYKSPLAGTYFRFIRFACLLISLLLMPLFLLYAQYPHWLSPAFQGLIPRGNTPEAVFVYVLFVELGLDLFKYASAHTSSDYSGAFGLLGGLFIGDTAISLEWATTEIIFYGAVTLLATLGLVHAELSDAIRLYRLFLILATGFFGLWGFAAALSLVFLSVLTTPVFGKKSYFWPLYPFSLKALRTLLFRYPASAVQPEKKGAEE